LIISAMVTVLFIALPIAFRTISDAPLSYISNPKSDNS
jgi:flagellar biosynthesis protein FliQ